MMKIYMINQKLCTMLKIIYENLYSLKSQQNIEKIYYKNIRNIN